MNLDGWIAGLGYDRATGTLLKSESSDVDVHPYGPELRAIMTPQEGPRGEAVLCIDRVPTVCLVSRELLAEDPTGRRSAIRRLCERLWNQNLVRLVLVLDQTSLEAWSVDSYNAEPQVFQREDESTYSTWSLSGLLGGEVLRDRAGWFNPKHRVDRTLLDGIKVLLDKLSDEGIDPARARRLVARVIFVTYLEDRRIVGDQYRASRRVRSLFDLIGDGDAAGLTELFSHLRRDFNGDFLSSADDEAGWGDLSGAAFKWLHAFLSRTALRTRQTSFWRYDFSQIPIELIASVYETFLSSRDADADGPASSKTKRKQGAYYTPRALADWVVEQALDGRDILNERIFDGACGSGMLLTAAYKRLIRAYEVRGGHGGTSATADFVTRSRLLTKHIYGGDIDEDACQLTAFSLYLALLSDLSPPDLEALRRGGHRLPPLTGNIRRGAAGDFFSPEGEAANAAKFSLFLSNPPWREVDPEDAASAALEDWRRRQPEPLPHIPKRQLAAAFALGAADCLAPGGRAALILPVNPFVSVDPTQQTFRAHLVGRYAIRQIINFSDMRRLMFAEAAHPFVVLIADARPKTERFCSIEAEQFEYWTPKADISLALGRLAVHGGDRAELPTGYLLDDVAHLSIRYWGSTSDASLLQRLRRRGRIANLISEHGWVDGKGFHLTDEDKRRRKESWYKSPPRWMSGGRFMAAERVPSDIPVITEYNLTEFPYEKIARVPSERFFSGPRVLWTDGAHPEEGVKAVFADRQFSFRHSVAVLSPPDTTDGRLTARFLTAYLRSPMGLWLLFLLSSSVASERPKLHLKEALDWPFWPIDAHPNPDRARSIMLEVDALMAKVEAESVIFQSHAWSNARRDVNALIYEYFDLSDEEIAGIEEITSYVGPAVQPQSLSFSALCRPLRTPPSIALVESYAQSLATAVRKWRDATGGEGEISVSLWSAKNIPIGAAVISIGRGAQCDDVLADDAVVDELERSLERALGRRSDALLTIPDLTIVEENRIILVKPLVARFWLRRSAAEDAGQLALRLQSVSRSKLLH